MASSEARCLTAVGGRPDNRAGWGRRFQGTWSRRTGRASFLLLAALVGNCLGCEGGRTIFGYRLAASARRSASLCHGHPGVSPVL